MKFLATFFRIFVGLLLIFSGLIKLNDPLGFQYKMEEYFSVFSKDLEPKQDSFSIKISAGNEVTEAHFEFFSGQKTASIKLNSSPWQLLNEGESLPIIKPFNINFNGVELMNNVVISEDSVSIDPDIMVQVLSDNGKEIFQQSWNHFSQLENQISMDVAVSEYVNDGNFWTKLFDFLTKYALIVAVAVCVFEVVLGFGLLIGWSKHLVLWLMILMMVFFTFLTFYSAFYNKVTDCGCFGNAIPLSPWQSFYKDVILIILIAFLTWKAKFIKPIFSSIFGIRFLSVIVLLSSLFALRNWYYLPVKNFLKFEKGKDIQDLVKCPEGAPEDIYENIFIYSKDGKDQEFTIDDLGKRNLKEEGYEFKDRIDKLIQKGCEPEVHDFKLMDASGSTDYVDAFLSEEGYKLFIVSHVIEKARPKTISKYRDLIQMCNEKEVTVYWATSSGSEAVEKFTKENDLKNVEFLYGDDTNLKSIIRSNPGLLLLKNSKIIETWPGTRLPSSKKLEKKMK